MSISFQCTNCNEYINVSYLKPGESAKCKNCKTLVIVPPQENNQENSPINKNQSNYKNLSLGGEKIIQPSYWQALSNPSSNSPEYIFSTILLYFSIGLLFHILEWKIISQHAIFNLSIIGSIFVLRACYYTLQIKQYKNITIAILIVCTINTITYLSEMFRLQHILYFNIRIIEVLLIYALYYLFMSKNEIFKEYKKYFTIIFIFFAVDLLMFALSFMYMPIFIWINRLFANSDIYLEVFNIFGMLLPMIFIHLVGMIIFTYISFSMYNTYRKSII